MKTIHEECFERALKQMHGKSGNPYEDCSIKDVKDNYLATPAHPEHKRIRYSMVASTRSRDGEMPVRVEIVFEKIKDRTWNEEKMKALEEYKDQIENALGNERCHCLVWKPKGGIKGNPGVAYKVVYECADFADGLKADNVDDVACWLADNMLKLAKAAAPYLAKID
ncbi:MAG: DUF4268 domain-containing protein [Lentisphaerota bacterium]